MPRNGADCGYGSRHVLKRILIKIASAFALKLWCQ
jgi:hypothetical protein